MASVRARVISHFRAHHEWYWAPALYCVAIAYLYRQVFFPGHGPQRGMGWDTIESYWADLAYLSRQLGHGHWPLWNPYERGGFPYLAMPERGPYYPINWLFAGWGAAVHEVSWWAIQLKGFAHHLIAALSMHLYLRSRRLPRSAAVVGGLAWLGSAPLLIHKASSVIWPLVWVPLVWLAVDKLVERPGWRRGAGLGGALVLTGVAGSAPGFFYVLLLAFPYGAFRVALALADARREQRLPRLSRELGLAIAVAAAVTVSMLLVTVVPSLELTAMSQRAERTVAYALQFPLPVGRALAGMWVPDAGMADVYLGVLVLLLVVCGAVMTPLRDRGVQLLFLGCAVFFLILSFGRATPILGWLVEYVPGFGLFRVSNRYKLLVAPLLAAGAAYGVAALLEVPRRWGWQRIAGLAAGLLVLILVSVLVWTHPVAKQLVAKRPAAWLSLVLAAAALVLVAATLFTPQRWAWLVVVAMVPLVVYEPQHYVHFKGPALEKRVDNLEDREWLEGLADVTVDYRIYDEFVLEQRAGSRLGVREFRSYPAGGSLEPVRYRKVIQYARNHPEILGAFNIRYVFHGRHHRAGMGPNHFKKPLDQLAPGFFRRLDTPRCARMKRPKHCPVFEALHVAPLAAWYGAARVEPPRARSELDALRRQLADRGELRVAVLEPEAAAAIGADRVAALTAAAADPPAPVTGRVTEYDADRVSLHISAPGPGIVVLNDTMYPGWRVEVDGTRVSGFYVNWLVRGVAVDRGDHTITWRFEPRHQRLYRWLYALGLFFLLFAAVAPRRRWWRRASDRDLD